MIEIIKNPNGDTRTAPLDVTFEQFQEANDMHRDDVAAVMYELSLMLDRAGELHDCTKKTQEAMFFRDFKNTQMKGDRFEESEWYQLHVASERHHLLAKCPDDVNLLDVIGMIVDCTCARLARGGEMRELEIDNDILRLAVQNTVLQIESMVVVKEGDANAKT